MPNIQLPDNSVVAFPDHMPEAEINSAIHTHLYGNTPNPNAGESFVNKSTDMMTFGLDKPFNAALEAGLTKGGKAIKSAFTGEEVPAYGDLYDQYMRQQENVSQLESEQHPIASAAGDVTGLVGSLGMGLPKTGAKAVGEAPGLWQSIKTAAPGNAAAGAAIGGLNSLGYADGTTEDRLAAGGKGMLMGGLSGAVLPAALQTSGAAVSHVAKPLIERFTAEEGAPAAAKLAQALQRDQITPEQAREMLASMGDNASIADLGQNTMKLGRAMYNVSGEAKNTTANFLNERQNYIGEDAPGQVGRVTDAVTKGLGVKSNYFDEMTAASAQQKAASPLYQEAFAKNQNINSPVINRILETPAGKSALKKAAEFMQNDMSLMAVRDPELEEQAALIGQSQPIASGLKLRTLDYIKQSMDDQISSLYKVGQNKEGSSVNALKNSLLRELDKADSSGGLYAKGRAMWSGASKSQDALEMGRAFMGEDAPVTNRQLADMSDSEKEMFRIGAAQKARDMIYATPKTADAANKIFGTPAKEEKFAAVFPDKKSFTAFKTAMRNEMKMFQTKNTVMGNSSTAEKLNEVADSGIDAGHLIEAASGNWKGLLSKIGMNTLNKLQAGSLSEKERGILARQLFNSDAATNQASLKQVEALIKGNPRIDLGNPMLGMAAQTGRVAGMLPNY